MAYDAVDGYAVLFGGFECTPTVDCGGYLNDTWAYSNGVWTNLTTTASIAPPFRPGSEMVWDGADGYVLLVTTTNTTWSFVGGVWSEIVTSNGPGNRYLPGLAYDAADGYVVLFGGASLSSPVGQTWTYRAGAWTRLNTSTSPWNREDPMFAYDAADGYTVLYGGAGFVSGSQVAFNDTWTFVGGNWTLLPNANGPSPYRTFDAFGYDPLTSSIVAVVYPTYSSGNYLWEFAGGAWSQVNGVNQSATPLFEAGAYDPTSAEFVFVSGSSWIYYDVPNWISIYSLVNDTWAQIGTSPTIPSYSDDEGLVYDPSADGLLLTDGQSSYIYHNASWTPSPTASTARGCSPGGLAYDAADGYVLLFCGQTWKFEGGNWTELVQYPSDAWPSGGSGVMAYDSTDHYVVLFGAGYSNQTWTWSAGNWTNRTSPSLPAPSSRTGDAMVDDPTDGYLVLFGGVSATRPYSYLNDTWTFSGGRWSNLSGGPAPSPRAEASMAFDALAGYVLLFGGADGYPYVRPPTDTWAFSGGAWSNVTPGGGLRPEGRSEALLGYDPTTEQTLLFGGYSSFLLSPSEWLWGPPPAYRPPVITGFQVLPNVTDQNVSISLLATLVGGAPPITYAYAGLPSGCAGRSTPDLMCDPQSIGVFRISLTATDSTGNFSSSSLTLTVNPTPALLNISLTPNSIQLGQVVGVDALFAGGTGPFSFQATGLPPGCATTSAAVFSCVPSYAGNYTVRVSEFDRFGLSATGSAALMVLPPPTLGTFQISQFSVAPSEVAVGGTIVVSTVTSGGLAPISFNYSGLPKGCSSLNASGFFCTPTETGNFTIGVMVSDSTPVLLIATAPLLVDPLESGLPASAPRISSFVALPAAVVLGASVTFEVSVSGGTPPYAYAYSGLPAGCIATDGPTLSCVPTLSGQWAVGVTVTDSRGTFVQALTSLSVSAPPATPGASTPGSTASPSISETVLLVAIGILVGLLVSVVAFVLLGRRPREPSASATSLRPPS